MNAKLVAQFVIQDVRPKLKNGKLKILCDHAGDIVGLVSTQDYDRFVDETNQSLVDAGYPPVLKRSTKQWWVCVSE